jgi:hypothetical protein
VKPSTAKLLLHVGTGALAALGDLAIQLSSGALVNAPRIVLLGVGLGLFVKFGGQWLAYLVEQAAAGGQDHQDPTS